MSRFVSHSLNLSSFLSHSLKVSRFLFSQSLNMSHFYSQSITRPSRCCYRYVPQLCRKRTLPSFTPVFVCTSIRYEAVCYRYVLQVCRKRTLPSSTPAFVCTIIRYEAVLGLPLLSPVHCSHGHALASCVQTELCWCFVSAKAGLSVTEPDTRCEVWSGINRCN